MTGECLDHSPRLAIVYSDATVQAGRHEGGVDPGKGNDSRRTLVSTLSAAVANCLPPDIPDANGAVESSWNFLYHYVDKFYINLTK